MTTRTRIGAALVALIGTMALSVGAHAEVYDFPGTSCVSNGSVYYTTFGKALNGTNGAQTFLCPMLRGDPDHDSIDDIVVRVEDEHASKDVECYVRTCEGNGGCAYSLSTKSFGVGSQQLAAISAQGYDMGDALLVCSVPAKDDASSGIVSYRYDD